MQIVKELFLDFYQSELVVVTAKQGDIGRFLKVTLLDNGNLFSVPPGSSATIARGEVWNYCTINDDGTILAPITADMRPGRVPAEIELSNGDDRLSSWNFILDVQFSARDDEAIEGSNEYSVLQDLIEQVGGLEGDITNAEINFTPAQTRTNIQSGDTIVEGFSKISKWFSDLGDAAFDDVANDLNQTTAGKVLDARQGRVLDQSKVDIMQGASNSGKVLGIGEDGNVTPVDPPQGMTEEQEEQLNQNTEDIARKVDKYQGTSYSGKLLGIGEDGNVTPVDPPTDPQKELESAIEAYYALRRTGKVYQTKIWKFATNPTPTGEKLLDNAGLVFEPSTDTEEGQDDYLNGQNPLFEWVHCNYIRDADGTARPIAIEGMDNYATTGSVDVGTMQMSFWWKWDASNSEYDLVTISDTPHPELGLIPWCESVKADGTVLPWCIGSAYVSGIASDGKPRSQPRLKPARKQSHNNMIANYQAKGAGYWGAGACRNNFKIIFDIIKGATKSTQELEAGLTNYSYQYEAAIQSSSNNTYFPVTNAQAANIPVGNYVSVGYGSNNDGTANNDRVQDSVHAYADSVKVLSKAPLSDGANTAIYLDIPEESAFNTMPHVYTEAFSAPIILSSMLACAGTTDTVIGHHDGSPVSNTDGKHAYRVQGREYAVGGYIVASDTAAWLNADGTRTIYVAGKGTAHSSSDSVIKSTYKVVGTIPASADGQTSDWYIGDDSVDYDTGAWWPSAQGSGSTQGVCDKYYAGGTGSDAFREYLMCGRLGSGAGAGGSSLFLGGGLEVGHWSYIACD